MAAIIELFLKEFHAFSKETNGQPRNLVLSLGDNMSVYDIVT
jgi:hypothetical protein